MGGGEGGSAPPVGDGGELTGGTIQAGKIIARNFEENISRLIRALFARLINCDCNNNREKNNAL